MDILFRIFLMLTLLPIVINYTIKEFEMSLISAVLIALLIVEVYSFLFVYFYKK